MSLLKRRGLTPLSINVTPNSARIANSPILIPATPSPLVPMFSNLIVNQSPTLVSSPHLFQTPNSGRNFISPRPSPKMARLRKCSNISASSMHTPSLSPISMNNSSILFDESSLSLSETANKSANIILNQRFSISPLKLRFSSTSSTDSINTPNKFLKSKTHKRSPSFFVPPTPNVNDDVFEDSVKKQEELN